MALRAMGRPMGILGETALAWIAGSENDPQRASRGLHHPAKARRVVQIFLSGAASHVDTFDYKPLLVERRGRKFDPGGKVELFQSQPGVVTPSYWQFRQRGQSGQWVSDLLPHLAGCADHMAVIRSMHSRSNVHGPATFLQNTGFVLPGFPSMGAWVVHGLGRLCDDLPAFVVLPDSRGVPPNGPANWGSGFLPASSQGTAVRVGGDKPIRNLFPESGTFGSTHTDPAAGRLLDNWNRRHARARPTDTRLQSRVDAYSLAAKLQLSAPGVLDLNREPESVRRRYGLDRPETADFGGRCLAARRLLEKGVRFVQIWSGADNGFPRRNWDSHEDLPRDHAMMAKEMDLPAATLIQDLKERGLLDDTIVLWTTEFGRMPCSQGGMGRDHNPDAFTTWMAGGGIKGGVSYGASDEWGWKAVDNPTTNYDVHATILHLLGVDHRRLTFRVNGVDRRLTDVHGHVIREVLA